MMLHDLRKISYLHIIRNSNLTGCRVLKSTDKLKNGGLSGTILSDKAYLVVLADVEIDLIQQSKATVCNSQIVNRYHKSLYFNALFLITTYKDAKFI